MEHKRKVLLVDPKFQLKFSFYVCSWILGLSVIYPLLIFNLFDYFSRFLAENGNVGAVDRLKDIQGDLTLAIFLLQAFLLAVTFLISVFLSHRIAGPVYRMRKVFEAGRSGALLQSVKFRKDDHFNEMAQEYNLLAIHVREVLSKAEKVLESSGSGEATKDALKEIRALRGDPVA